LIVEVVVQHPVHINHFPGERPSAKSKQPGFSLVEMVVVILVLGIIVAIAASKMFDTAGDARINSTKQNLAVIRDALKLYKSQTDAYPAAASIVRRAADRSFPAECRTVVSTVPRTIGTIVLLLVYSHLPLA